jgi:glyoxylase-like metal-dependent hydrolase (beta-lactamase superfamily II)
MKDLAYTRGLHDLGNAVYAYLQPGGSWGWSNAGLIVDGGMSLLVDTLYDLRLTQEMLATMRRSLSASEQIDMLVNTHANGDHCYGNQLVEGARIIASVRTADEMFDLPPMVMAAVLAQAQSLGPVGAFFQKLYGAFDFTNITLTPPTETFEQRLDLRVGSKEVTLLEVGPAHTRGDTLVYIPDDRVIFTGDIIFAESHPIVWTGPVSNWIRACQTILDLNVETVVPGHGPVTDKAGVRKLQAYFEYLLSEVRPRFEAGLSELETARDLPMEAYEGWSDGERLVVNVAALYRELRDDQEKASVMNLFGLMAEYSLDETA